MIKNILIYTGLHRNSSIVENLKMMGYCCVEHGEEFADEHNDAQFVMKLIYHMETEDIQLVISSGYCPLLATACEMRKIPYASWICELPHDSLMSKTVLYQHNYLFCFDRVYARWLSGLGCSHVFHFPLAVDVDALTKKDLETEKVEDIPDISYVGDFNSGERRLVGTEGIPEYYRGYISGIEEAQIRVYGYNFVKEMTGNEIPQNILRKAVLQRGDLYFDNPVYAMADLINQEITDRERKWVVEKLSERYRVHVYSESEYRGPVLFRDSRININVTHRAVESGIPQRVLDILACGGFCISNYQTEIAEYFEDGREIVMYTDMEDLIQKTDWFLRHDAERIAIARAGQNKVREAFSMKDRLACLIRIIEEDLEWKE